jgi:hypothetical protein
MKKFYYVSYACRSHGQWQFCGRCIDVHPLEFMKTCQDNYRNVEVYIVISWQEIPEEEFKKYDGQF